ncbi:MAG: LysM peptidoglycan-binding domain-containing protein [Bernardetiaceae bacterium]
MKTSFCFLLALLWIPTLLAQQPSTVEQFPRIQNIEEKEINGRNFVFAIINGKKGIIGTAELLLSELASAGNISYDDFAKYNDLAAADRLQAGQVYYFEPKEKKGSVPSHVLALDQSIWEVSQKYGIQKKFIYKYNRLKKDETVRPGLVLFLQSKRSNKIAPEYKEAPEKQLLWGQKPPMTPKEAFEAELTEAWADSTIQALLPKRDDLSPDLSDPSVTLEADMTGKTNRPGGGMDDGLAGIGGVPDIDPFAETTTPSKSTASADEYVYHDVQAAESLYMISRMYGVTPEQIHGWNNLKGEPQEGSRIIVGIKKKGTERIGDDTSPFGEQNSDTPTTQATGYTYHTVKPAESLYAISRMYGTTPEQIQAWNNISGMNVTEGTRLIVGEGVGDATTASADDPFANLSSTEPPASTDAAPFGDNPFFTPPSGGSTTPAFGENNSLTHTVQSGETLWGIARSYGVKEEEIKAWNEMSSGQVQAGQVLKITPPAAATRTDATAGSQTPDQMQPGTYRVKSGDTFWKLESELGVTAQQLKTWNKIEELYAGQLLYVVDPATIKDTGQSKAIQTTDPALDATPQTNPNLQAQGLVPPSSAAGVGKHVVQPNETTYYIAAVYDIRHSQLQAWNHLTNEKLKQVKAGDTLVVNETAFLSLAPAPVIVDRVGTLTYHTATKGETLFSISQRYGITLSQIRAWNKKENTDDVFEGERLIVKK